MVYKKLLMTTLFVSFGLFWTQLFSMDLDGEQAGIQHQEAVERQPLVGGDAVAMRIFVFSSEDDFLQFCGQESPESGPITDDDARSSDRPFSLVTISGEIEEEVRGLTVHGEGVAVLFDTRSTDVLYDVVKIIQGAQGGVLCVAGEEREVHGKDGIVAVMTDEQKGKLIKYFEAITSGRMEAREELLECGELCFCDYCSRDRSRRGWGSMVLTVAPLGAFGGACLFSIVRLLVHLLRGTGDLSHVDPRSLVIQIFIEIIGVPVMGASVGAILSLSCVTECLLVERTFVAGVDFCCGPSEDGDDTSRDFVPRNFIPRETESRTCLKSLWFGAKEILGKICCGFGCGWPRDRSEWRYSRKKHRANCRSGDRFI